MRDVLVPQLARESELLTAGFTLRAFSREEEPLEGVRERIRLGTGFPELASVGQVHEAQVATVDRGGHVPAHDGLVTGQPGVLLSVIAADCALVLLADQEAGVVGACHAGWRGAVAKIPARTIDSMLLLGALPSRIQAFVAPCISREAFEVGEEVASQFEPQFVHRREDWPRPHVDLRGAVAGQLASHGVAEESIEIAESCTASSPDFYSYRAENGTRGRMIGFIGLNV